MRKYIFLLPTIVLFSCGVKSPQSPPPPPTDNSSSIDVLKDEPVEKETPTKREKYNAAETVLTDLVHTKLEVSFDWKNSQMKGIETLTAKPHFYPSDSLILKAKGMTINSVKMDGKTLTFDYVEDKLKINLGKTFKRAEQYTIVIDYIARPEERKTGGSDAITSDKGLYFINPTGEEKGKMPQIWTQGETEASSVWFPTIDAPNSKTSQEIFMTVDNKFVTLSNGKLVSSKKNADGTRTDYWKQEYVHAPYLFMMAVGEFKTVKDSYTKINGSKLEVNYIVEPEWEKYADDIFGETPEMIEYFSKLLGVEYPWDKYSQIVVRDYVSGAMENTGAVIFGDFVYKTDRELLDDNDQSTIAHELFHHWFGDLVTCESWANLTLNESFANYSQYLWDEHRYGLDEAAFNAEKEADGYYQQAQMQGHHDLVWLDYEAQEQMFDGHSYNKGGRILHMLRSYVGDEAFFASLNLYLTQNKFKAAEFHQLRLAFEEVTGEDLNWFFNQWYLASGHPIIDIAQTLEGNKAKITMTQKQNLDLSPIYKLPLQVAVIDDAGKHIHSVVLDELEETFEFPVTGKLKCIIPDYQQMLLAKVREEKPQDQFVQQYYAGEHYGARDKALRQGTKKMDSLSSQLVLDALHDDFWSIRSLAIEKAGKLKEGYKALATDIIHTMAMKDKSSAVRSAALNYLESIGDPKSEEMNSLAVDHDSSYLVVSTALRNLGKSNPELAMQKAKALENEPSSKMLVGIAGLYGSYGDVTQFGFFEKVLTGNTLAGFDQLGTMNTFSVFVGKQQIDLWERALPVYQSLKENGTYYTQMFMPQNIDYLLDGIEQNKFTITEEIAQFENDGNATAAQRMKLELARWTKLETEFGKLKEEAE